MTFVMKKILQMELNKGAGWEYTDSNKEEYCHRRRNGGEDMEQKKLYRSESNRMICGVCAGIAEYILIDPTIVRLLFALLGFTGSGIVAYFIAAIIIPTESMVRRNY